MASAPLIHARYCYSPIFGGYRRNGSLSSSPSASASPSSSSSFSSSSACSSSSNCCSSSSLGFSSSGTSNNWRNQGFRGHSMSTIIQGNFGSSRGITKDQPDHLLVLVHGILASPSDWTYVQAELKKRLGRKFLIYASSSNTYSRTFAGIDGAGKRLADEVMQVVQRTESLKKISFLAHSLGGLIARYAVAVLYSPNSLMPNSQTAYSSKRGMIAGLEPINFITLATPHLGVRGKRQLPFLLGVPLLEKLAAPIAPILAGLTGSQLFLTDGKPDKPPLLLRMASDCEDGKFISALGAFRARIVYANVSYDRILFNAILSVMKITIVPFIYISFLQHMVGWRTSSIRRETEIVKPPRRSLDGYKHVVDVDYIPPISSDGPHFPPEAAKAKEAAQKEPSTKNTVEYHEIMEEEMIHGLQQLGWKRVDVSFHSAMWPFFAHNNIHVKNEWLHNAGVGVVAHVADTLKQEESSQFITSSFF
ncbi:hypothetical protein G4B88_009870 [Cannabis sativa]|uniref:DUF676 domain-containing protein n=1 Tax=Cannabis sativa TaxID=3483 RepID=A0A7J6HSJ1_CANSA|nr:hypothetical protein G4B88_009870 [Cannabis sativa]